MEFTCDPTVNHEVEKPSLAVRVIAAFMPSEKALPSQAVVHSLMHEAGSRAANFKLGLNRYYYQKSIPIKDAAILARSEDPFPSRLAQRIHDMTATHKPGALRSGCVS